jgi:arginyl-tRNA--protein-N-Asp/Glu arginylyltransferase
MIAYHYAAAADNFTPVDLDRALSLGWFRMRQFIFTTTHLNPEECNRVHWLRYPLREIRSHRSHRHIQKINSLFRVLIDRHTQIRADHEELYSRYHRENNFGAESIFQALIGEDEDRSVFKTYCISVYDGDQLVAGGYFDTGELSAASILHFYDPQYKRNSLGKYLMLITADYLRAQGFQYYYPGYVIAGKTKMDYKLFIGKEATQYFDPSSHSWKYFEDSILLPETLTEEYKRKVILAFS